jgi:hypothetical protein
VLAFARPRVVVWDAVTGSGAVSLHPLALLSSGDGNVAGITANVDHAAEVTIGVVEGVAVGFLVVRIRTFEAQSPFLIKDPAAFIEIHLLLLIF